jgi:hypothetical protein
VGDLKRFSIFRRFARFFGESFEVFSGLRKLLFFNGFRRFLAGGGGGVLHGVEMC